MNLLDGEESEGQPTPLQREGRSRWIRWRPPAWLALTLKVLWVGAVMTFGVWYLISNWADVIGYAKSVDVWAVILSLASLTLARVLLAEISRRALDLSGTKMPLSLSFYLNSISQLGKYVPGSVWHLVGRVGLYRQHGVTVKASASVLAIENGVLLASGVCLGVGLSVSPLSTLFGVELPSDLLVVVAAMGGVMAWWIVVSQVLGRLVTRFAPGTKVDNLGFFVRAIAFWIAFGVAFWLLLPENTRTAAMLPSAAGTIALAWIVGYASPFAPAGLGVREAVIVALLGPSIGVPTAAAAATGSRIVWTLQELSVAPLAAAKLSGWRKTALRAGAPTDGQDTTDASEVR